MKVWQASAQICRLIDPSCPCPRTNSCRDGISTKPTVKPTVAFAHLARKIVLTRVMLGLLTQAGYGVSSDESDANVVVVNTCSFIQDAREESVRTLVGLAEQGKELIIAGCLAQHFQEELLTRCLKPAIVGTGITNTSEAAAGRSWRTSIASQTQPSSVTKICPDTERQEKRSPI